MNKRNGLSLSNGKIFKVITYVKITSLICIFQSVSIPIKYN